MKKLADIAKEQDIELAPTKMIGNRKILKVETEADIYQHLALQIACRPSYAKTWVKSKLHMLTLFPVT